MLNFTLGPVMSNDFILKIGAEQTPYFRTPEFSKINLENEQLIKELLYASEDSRAIFLTGSGTAGMEATVMNVFNEDDKVLIVNGGGFGQRFVDMCNLHNIDCDDIKLEFGHCLTKEMLNQYDGRDYTAFMVNICETSSGVYYDIDLISEFCKKNDLLLVVDAISSFLANDLNMVKHGVDVVIIGSQKALACPPGIAIIVLDEKAVERVENNTCKSMYFDIEDMLVNGIRGQTPYTPAITIILQLNARLKQLKEDGGIEAELKRISDLAQDFRNKITEFPFEVKTNCLSNSVTTVHSNEKIEANLVEILKNEYDIWVSTARDDLSETMLFRVGHMGDLTPEDNDILIEALRDMQKRGAKELGDYLIVGVTADDFDKKRGKINVHQSLMERIESVRATGLADEIIVEEYEGQKIDDIKRFDVDIFTVGSDWVGHFDYLKEYCDVIYLPRTEGVSSSDIRSKKRNINLGLVGEGNVLKKFYDESKLVNGIEVNAILVDNENEKKCYENEDLVLTNSYEELLSMVDAVYIISHPSQHYYQIKNALIQGKHVLCESPIALNEKDFSELIDLAKEKNLILMDSIKTAYSTAYDRLLLLLKGGNIGDIYSIDATCTSLREYDDNSWNTISSWAPTALLPIFQILGTDYKNKTINSLTLDDKPDFDLFTKIDFQYENAVASIKVANSVKSEGELVISGSEGYAYVPAPWWKTDYFELRFENLEDNKKYFYQLDGEGIRYELVAFAKSIELGKNNSYIDYAVSKAICKIIEDFENQDVNFLKKY